MERQSISLAHLSFSLSLSVIILRPSTNLSLSERETKNATSPLRTIVIINAIIIIITTTGTIH